MRLAAAFWGNIFQQPLLLRGVRFITIINVISAGVLALELANRDLFTTKSVFGLIWLFMSCIQVGAIYGACKTVKPIRGKISGDFPCNQYSFVDGIYCCFWCMVCFGES